MAARFHLRCDALAPPLLLATPALPTQQADAAVQRDTRGVTFKARGTVTRLGGIRWVALLALVCGLTSRMLLGQDAAPVHLVDQPPVHISQVAPKTVLVDFGRVAFGNLELTSQTPLPATDTITVRFGEALADGRVDTHPPGSVRYAEVTVDPAGKTSILVAPPADARNTMPPAVLTPASWGVVLPFRWVEVAGWPGTLRADQIRRRAAFDSTWVDNAGTFHSSDAMLDRVWDLCHYSIKATTFAGVFVDGDRERLAYEADAYLNQLGYYAGDANPAMPRVTFDRLMRYPTWPTEWGPHMVFMAQADWMETGDRQWLSAHYEGLKTKLLWEHVGPDGLVMSSPQQMRRGDIVDWPVPERDGYVFTDVNTVVNAFHLRALLDMAQLAEALGKDSEARAYRAEESTAAAAFQDKLFDPSTGLYRDGVGTGHSSLHANLFPLAFGLVPPEKRRHVATWLASRGMAGSVYAAQYLLEALFENGETTAALDLITAPGDRSWRHMVDSGTTITWEAWDQKFKPNQDWTHAWGAAPANLLPRFVLGAQPLTPGWGTALIQPHPGKLTSAEGRVPTPHGELAVSWQQGKTFRLQLHLPTGMRARVELPVVAGSQEVRVGSKKVSAHQENGRWVLDSLVDGSPEISER